MFDECGGVGSVAMGGRVGPCQEAMDGYRATEARTGRSEGLLNGTERNEGWVN